MHIQVLIDAFIRMVPSSDEKSELIDKCRREYADDRAELIVLDEFERTYKIDTALWWYVHQR